MANLTHLDPRAGVNGALRHAASNSTPPPEHVDALDDGTLREQIRQLAAVNEELLQGEIGTPAQGSGDLDQLLAENAQLRQRVEELEKLLENAGTEQGWADRQREYETLLEEKSEVIRALHQKMQEFKEGGSAGPAVALPEANDLLELQRQLEEERHQLREDEEALMRQMREMEMAMSKERAEFARQRTELQRMHGELTREVEQSARDAGLRDRLLALTRKQQEAVKAPGAAPEKGGSSVKQTGFFRRVFLGG